MSSSVGKLLDAASESTLRFCETALMMPVTWDTAPPGIARTSERHVSVALANEQVAMEVGLVAEWSVCEKLVRTLMAMTSEDTLEDQDITDGIREIMNIVSGGVKTRLNDAYPHLKTGLPVIHREDRQLQPQNAHIAGRSFSVGEHQAKLTVMLQERTFNEITLS